MHLIVIAWLYVILLYSLANDTFTGGIFTFLCYGLGPLALFAWMKRSSRRRLAETEPQEGGDSSAQRQEETL